MTRAAERSELGFERAHLRSEDELAMAEHARDRVVDRPPEAPPLRGNVDERDGRGIEAGTLIHLGQALDVVKRSNGSNARMGRTPGLVASSIASA
jgi:hypothetical protein